jgi:hypothetical protein
MRVIRIALVAAATVAISSSAGFGLAESAVAKTKPNLLLRFVTSKAPVGNQTLTIGTKSGVPNMSVRTKLGEGSCVLAVSATASMNDSLIDELSVGYSPPPRQCLPEDKAMPFPEGKLEYSFATFPFGHTLGKIVLKRKGSKTTEGTSELIPDESVSDLFSLASVQGGIDFECRYAVEKKLKGLWHQTAGEPLVIGLAGKLKLSGSDNESACPKSASVSTATVPAGESGFTELVFA